MTGKRFNKISVKYDAANTSYVHIISTKSLPLGIPLVLLSAPSFLIKEFSFIYLFLTLLYYPAVVHLWISLADCLAAAWCIVTFSNEPFLTRQPRSWLPLVPACGYFISFLISFYVAEENNHSNNNAEYLWPRASSSVSSVAELSWCLMVILMKEKKEVWPDKKSFVSALFLVTNSASGPSLILSIHLWQGPLPD